jgi:putative hydrolase of the HAD superfamily
VSALARRSVDVSAREAEAAMAAEIAFYRDNLQSAGDSRSLEHLRDRCARVLADHLPSPAARLPDLRATLLESLRFTPYPEVRTVLRSLRDNGSRLIVVSNWDVSLHEVLDKAGLAELVDGVITSSEMGVAKPEEPIFAAALRLAGVPAAAALHVGDDLEADYLGARSAGLDAVLVVRGEEPPPDGVPAITSLRGLLDGHVLESPRP